ncbi:PROTEIN TAPETUM DETERMINANT 1-LIKE-RELATED [Salix koriyanagi]|uniref:PROTEIN TAPETUM DETERMINANT 1-LIKE-RELATED n=1 Tax=Salix koriyanagi TaxID=2511006 RepID=A0A9Q0VH93_9ROSI|nr:PROTEIN TAPETUM DETERMINANT 1-LIKE-RELATED [Salix koriyanagi]
MKQKDLRNKLIHMQSFRISQARQGKLFFHHPSSGLVHPGQNQKPQHEVLGEIAETQCSTGVIGIEQGQEGTFPGGTPMFRVEIVNECPTGCTIHLSCASFRSEKVINPKVFRRIAPDDCLLNDGQPLPSGEIITFEYAAATQFPFTIKNIVC